MTRKLLTLLVCAFLATLSSSASVKPGIEVLRDRGYDILRGKKIGLITNPSGVDSRLKSTVDILFEAPEVELVALFAPEHGVRGDIYAGGRVESGRDPKTGLPVHSLYGSTRKPTPEMLSGLDAIVYDIQDVGCRSYTFISTLGLAMRACAEAGIEMVVLDRPNPLGGIKVEGPYVRPGFFSFVSQYRIPYIYGLTVGELAVMINEEGMNLGQKGDETPLKCRLGVVPMEGWRRSMLYKDTGLPWVLPSPNIPYPESAMCYPCSGLAGEFNGYLNIGIGYTLPFGTFAETWIDADELKERLDSYGIPGVEFRTIHYKPFSGRLAGKMVHGVQFFFTDWLAAPCTMIQFHVFQAVGELYGKNPFAISPDRIPMFNKVCGTDYVTLRLSASLKVSDIVDYWTSDVEDFRKLSENYKIYVL